MEVDSLVGAWSLPKLRKCNFLPSNVFYMIEQTLCRVQLISGSLSHENTGNQFGHASSIFTFILLAVTAVSQIVCLNRGLKVYDSTLVVPVFYGVYTAAGCVNIVIFVTNSDDIFVSLGFFSFLDSLVRSEFA